MNLRSGPYRARFARTRADVEAAQRIRFQVFNLELGEGLQASYSTGRDEDQYDDRCHHLLVEHVDSQKVVGTYRLMTEPMAGTAGFYSETEFHLEVLPPWIREEGVELGQLEWKHRGHGAPGALALASRPFGTPLRTDDGGARWRETT